MKKILILLTLFALVNMASAITITVDPNSAIGDYTTIQAAITDANGGDTVVVNPGTYVENISMLGKAITLRSTAPKIPAVVEATIIDGGATGSVITCNSGEGSSTVINGLTITNGDADLGGGMYNYSNSTVINCIFRHNTAGEGGGMWNGGFDTTVINCTFMENTGYDGGGMYNVGSWPTVTNCIFIRNWSGNNGGGMYNYDSAHPIITNCMFYDNSGNYGGGIHIRMAHLTATNCTFDNNKAASLGGGIYGEDDSEFWVANCAFLNNRSDFGAPWIYAEGNVNYNDGGGNTFDSSLPDTDGDGILDLMDNCPLIPNTNQMNITGDCTGDCTVNQDDLAIISSAWLDTDCDNCPSADITGDGKVDMFDLAELAANWLAGT
jgi:predicted outer membrane repeat protein